MEAQMKIFTKSALLAGLLITSNSAMAQPVSDSQAGQPVRGQSQMMAQDQMMGQGQMMNQAEMQRHMNLMHQSCGRMMSEMNRMQADRRSNGQPGR